MLSQRFLLRAASRAQRLYQVAYAIAMHYPTRSEIEELSPEDRLRLIGDVWETLEAASDCLGLPEGHQEVLDQRLAELENVSEPTLTWDEVLQKVRNQR